jgi:hypothetical protein
VFLVVTEVSVLCARVRVEEKRLIAALEQIGVEGRMLPPMDSPLPLGPCSVETECGALGQHRLVIDRLIDRSAAAVLVPLWRAFGSTIVGSGAATTLDRLAIARLLSNAGLPRPETALVLSEVAGLEALERFGGQATLLPLRAGSRELPLHDRQIAEAVLEHREVLGETGDSIALMQRGVVSIANRAEVVVVDGRAVAMNGAHADGLVDEALRLAEVTARLLEATLVSVTIALTGDRLVIWDIDSVPQFRETIAIGDLTVAEAVAALVPRLAGMAEMTGAGLAPNPALLLAEAGEHVALSA